MRPRGVKRFSAPHILFRSRDSSAVGQEMGSLRLRKLTSTLVIAAFSLAVLALTGCEDSSAVSEPETTPASGSAGPAAPETPRPTAAPQPTATAAPTTTPPPTVTAAPQPTATAAPTAPPPPPTATAGPATDRKSGADGHATDPKSGADRGYRAATDGCPAADRPAAYGRRRGAADRHDCPANGHCGPTNRHRCATDTDRGASDCRSSAPDGHRGRAASAFLYAAEVRRRDVLDGGASGAGQPGDRVLSRLLVTVLQAATR